MWAVRLRRVENHSDPVLGCGQALSRNSRRFAGNQQHDAHDLMMDCFGQVRTPLLLEGSSRSAPRSWCVVNVCACLLGRRCS